MFFYQLSAHTRVCATCEGAVFLDLKHDAYVGISPDQARALAALVADWPQPSNSLPADDVARSFAESLCKRGLLVHASVAARDRHRDVLAAPTEELIPWEHMPWRHIRFEHVLAVFRALFIASALLRFSPFERVVARHQSQRALRPERFDMHRARELVSAYRHIRTWIFPRRNRCLLDSLTLLEFLNAFGIHPRWVIGVQFRPFSAHSWIQYEQWVLSDTPAYVREFTPILVV